MKLARDPRDAATFRYDSSGRASHTHSYLAPKILDILQGLRVRRVFDLGCGNGAMADELNRHGYEVTGVDISKDGIAVANNLRPHLNLYEGSAYTALAERFGTFPCVISLEVVEHLYAPSIFAKTVFDLLEPGGTALISTPYNGFLKNVVIALTNNFDHHVSALWDHGHIKFWSMNTLGRLLREADFAEVIFHRVGRIPPLAKSMIAVAKRPQTRQNSSAEEL